MSYRAAIYPSVVSHQEFTLWLCLWVKKHMWLCINNNLNLSVCVRLHWDYPDILLYCQNKQCNNYSIRFKHPLPHCSACSLNLNTSTCGSVVSYCKSYWKVSTKSGGNFYHFQILALENVEAIKLIPLTWTTGRIVMRSNNQTNKNKNMSYELTLS